MNKEIKSLLIFLAVAFALTWGMSFAVIYPMAKVHGYGTSPIMQGVVALLMFFPALSVVITRLLTKEGFKDCKIRPHFKGNVKTYLIAWFAMPVLCVLTAVAYFLLFPDRYDPTSGYMVSQLAAQGVEATPELLRTQMITQCIAAVLLAPLLNFIPAFGEEWGWRGYMMPKLLKMTSFPTACILGGLIWGIWHAPVIALGHNYGLDYVGAPWLGISLMCIFCIVGGTIFTWWSAKTGSCIPAVIGHASLNGCAAAPLYFIASNDHSIVGPTMCGAVGIVIMGVIAVAIMVKANSSSRSM